MLWLFIAAALLVVAVVLVRRLFFPPAGWPGPGYIRVVYPNPRGWGTIRKWEKLSEPDPYPENGASYLGPYVERLLASTASFTTLSFFTPDGERGSSLWKAHGALSIHLNFDWRRKPEREARARAFFASRGFKTDDDYLAGNGRVRDATRVLSWTVEGDAETLTALCRSVLRELCDVQDEDGLDIDYEEREFQEP